VIVSALVAAGATSVVVVFVLAPVAGVGAAGLVTVFVLALLARGASNVAAMFVLKPVARVGAAGLVAVFVLVAVVTLFVSAPVAAGATIVVTVLVSASAISTVPCGQNQSVDSFVVVVAVEAEVEVRMEH